MYRIYSYIYSLLLIIYHRERSEANLESNVQENNVTRPLVRNSKAALNTSKSGKQVKSMWDHSAEGTHGMKGGQRMGSANPVPGKTAQSPPLLKRLLMLSLHGKIKH